ncbi:hypothetical protein Tco_1051946 [Tanacetum coccineum]
MELFISQDIVHIAVNSLAAINDYKNMQKSFMDDYNETLELKAKLAKKNDMIEKEFFIINDLQAQLKAKNISIEKLKKHITNLKEKNVVDSAQTLNKSNVVTSKVYKLDLPPLSPCIKNNGEAHVDYLKHTQNNVDILHEIVEQSKELRPFDSDLDSALSCSTEASGSQTKSNTKKNRITRTSRSNKKNNKVEDQPRIVKSSLNNVNRVSNTPCNANVKHSVQNANSELICATCNKCMFDAIHDSCIRVYLNNVNARVKSKSVKSVKSNKKKVCKSTGKIFTNVGYRWIQTGRTFTIVGNTCPLTKIISTKVVPPRKSTSPTIVK